MIARTEACVSSCHVGAGPFEMSVSKIKGTAAARLSHANRSYIGAPLAFRSRRLPTAKQTGEIMIIPNAATLKSYPMVPQIIKRPTVEIAMPTPCISVGTSRKITAASAMVNNAWLCTMTLERPTGTPCAIPKA